MGYEFDPVVLMVEASSNRTNLKLGFNTKPMNTQKINDYINISPWTMKRMVSDRLS